MSRLLKLAGSLGLAMFALAPVAVSTTASAAERGHRGGPRVQQQSVPYQSPAAASVRTIQRNFYPSTAGGARSVYRGNRGGGGGIAHNPGRHDNGHNRRHRNRVYYAVPSYSYDSYAYSGFDGDCRYYWRRYQRTGNPVWKHRYYQCIE